MTKIKVKKFETKNILNLNSKELNNYVYRLFPFETLLEILIENKLTLAKTNSWEDPYENYALKCHWILKDHSVTPLGLDEYYGQCWTFCEESDALWRIYSANNNSVRVKTTVNKLFNVISNDNSPENRIKSFIGKVRYDSKTNIQNYFSAPNGFEKIAKKEKAPISILAQLIKRNEFEHEKEVRILYHKDSNSPKLLPPIIKFNINPNELFEEITLDPRISDRYANIFSKTIVKLGYKGLINKSELYRLDPINIYI